MMSASSPDGVMYRSTFTKKSRFLKPSTISWPPSMERMGSDVCCQ